MDANDHQEKGFWAGVTGERTLNRRSVLSLPLAMDLANPSLGFGWGSKEPLSLAQRGPENLILALSFFHQHLFSAKVLLGRMAHLANFDAVREALREFSDCAGQENRRNGRNTFS